MCWCGSRSLIGGANCSDCARAGVADKSEGALLRHELAYCLGQMRDAAALPVLESVLRDVDDDPIVRHEVTPMPCMHALRQPR